MNTWEKKTLSQKCKLESEGETFHHETGMDGRDAAGIQHPVLGKQYTGTAGVAQPSPVPVWHDGLRTSNIFML